MRDLSEELRRAPVTLLWREQWSFDLIQSGERLFLSVVLGTVAIYELQLELTEKERHIFRRSGITMIEALVEDICAAPSHYGERKVRLPAPWSALPDTVCGPHSSLPWSWSRAALGLHAKNSSPTAPTAPTLCIATTPPTPSLSGEEPWREGLWVVTSADGWDGAKLKQALKSLNDWARQRHRRARGWLWWWFQPPPLSVIFLTTSTREELCVATEALASPAGARPARFVYLLSLDQERLVTPKTQQADPCQSTLERQRRALFAEDPDV